jgi:hypothetical protein
MNGDQMCVTELPDLYDKYRTELEAKFPFIAKLPDAYSICELMTLDGQA